MKTILVTGKQKKKKKKKPRQANGVPNEIKLFYQLSSVICITMPQSGQFLII